MSNRKNLMSFVVLAACVFPAIAQSDAGVSARTDGQASSAKTSTHASTSALASFPTYFIGPYPPAPPYGFVWNFSHYDYFGRAHWYLVRC